VKVPVTVNLVSADEAAAAALDAEVTEQVWLLQAAKARRQAMEAADRGDWEGSRSMLADAAGALRSQSLGAASPDAFLAEANLLDASVEASAADDPMWRKRMHQQSRRAGRGRPTA
jgi:hypothetical protein